MYQDAKEELQRLEEALLEEDALEEVLLEDEELPEEEALSQEQDALLDQTRRIPDLEDISRLPRSFYNSDRTDVELEEYAQQVQEDTKGLTGLTVTAILLAAGIVGVLLWWILRYGGMLG